MAANEDSRAFTVLKQNAEDFKASFDEDVTQCLAILDSKITELLRDQESISDSYGDAKRLNAHMEFSKSKLSIFVSMKDLLNEMESSWVEQLSELKEAFVENIEIFLAGTKLEVKEDSVSRIGGRKSLSSLKARKSYQNSPSTPSTVSSLYPTLINTAKHIPVLNSLLPKCDVQENESEQDSVDSTPQSVKPIRKLLNSPTAKEETPGRRKNSVRFMDAEVIEIEDEEMEDIEEVEEIAPVQKRGRGRKPAVSTPVPVKKAPAVVALQNEAAENDIAPVGTPVRSGRGARKSILNTPTSLKKSEAGTPLRRRNAAENRKESHESTSSDSSDDKPEAVAVAPEIKTRRGSRALPTETVVNVTSGRQKRTPARRGGRAAANQTAPEIQTETTENNTNKVPSPVGPKTPKNVHFSLGLDINEDLDIYSPVVDLTRSAPRRKTTVNPVLDTLPDLFLTPDVARSKSKRKTIAGDVSEITVAPSPKRLKKSASRSSIGPSMLAMETNETQESDLLDGDEASGSDTYTTWIPLSEAGAKVPAQPGVYELKVTKAKNTAYIGSCESLRQKLTLHRLQHNSGHKHLDKFVMRNAADVLVRYEKTPTLADAQEKQKTRVQSFVSQFNKPPAFN